MSCFEELKVFAETTDRSEKEAFVMSQRAIGVVTGQVLAPTFKTASFFVRQSSQF